MLLSTAKRYVKGYTESCIKRTGEKPNRNILRDALRNFANALKVNKIPL